MVQFEEERLQVADDNVLVGLLIPVVFATTASAVVKARTHPPAFGTASSPASREEQCYIVVGLSVQGAEQHVTGVFQGEAGVVQQA